MHTIRSGAVLLIAFILTQSVRDVYLGHLFGSLSLFETAFMAFGAAALLFGGGLAIGQPQQLRLLLAHWRLVAAVNLTTLIAWLSYFGALRLVTPAAANLAFSGVAPLAVASFAALGLASAGERTVGPLERSLHAALFATVCLLAATVGAGEGGLADIAPAVGMAGVGLAMLAGTAITAETIFAKRMNEHSISALAIVGVRFSLVALIAGGALLGSNGAYAGQSGTALIAQGAILIAILIGPIYLAQKGLALTTPLISGVLLSLAPVSTLILQSVAGTAALSPAMLLVTLAYAGCAVAAAAAAARHQRADQPAPAPCD